LKEEVFICIIPWREAEKSESIRFSECLGLCNKKGCFFMRRLAHSWIELDPDKSLFTPIVLCCQQGNIDEKSR